MTSLFPPRESLVVTSRLGTGNSRTFFYGVEETSPTPLQRVDPTPSHVMIIWGYFLWPNFPLVEPQSTYRGRVEIDGVYICLSRSVHRNFVRDGRYSERGWACTLTPPVPGWANFSIMMECTPESGHCHSVCSL
jgi:hypothetical protein